MGGTNLSGYLNDLLKREQWRILEQAALEANRDETHDPAYQKEFAIWERTLTDGLEPTSSPKPHT